MSDNRPIVKRIYWCFKIKLVSPICIGNGIENITDCDILLDSNGNPFIPGTSIAGAIRDYMGYKGKCIMGFETKGDDLSGSMSSLYFSDVTFKEKAIIDTRDGVQLNEDKIAIDGGKFDYQILSTGAEANIFINAVIREGDNESDFEELIATFVERVNNGEIRFGAKKNRGLGRIKIEKNLRKVFTKANVREYIDQKSKMHIPEKYETFKPQKSTKELKYDSFYIPLKLHGGISIRKYSVASYAPDFESIKCNNVSVIPGSSWNGAIRVATFKILRELGVQTPDEHLDIWFGNKNGEDKAKQSMVVFGESKIKDGTDKVVTRNAINRFDASTKDTALYTESVHYGGNTGLSIMVRKTDCNKALLGALGLVIEDLRNGLIAVGGETAIGRGLLEVEKDFVNPLLTEENMLALAKELRLIDYENIGT